MLHVEHQLFRLGAALASEDLLQLDGRGDQRLKAKLAKDLFEDRQHMPAQHHLLGQYIAHSFGQPGLNAVHHNPPTNKQERQHRR